eukprot:84356-Prorocentrum_minimum.AAC.1
MYRINIADGVAHERASDHAGRQKLAGHKRRAVLFFLTHLNPGANSSTMPIQRSANACLNDSSPQLPTCGAYVRVAKSDTRLERLQSANAPSI